MAKLRPVNFDPFAAKLKAVDYDPFAPPPRVPGMATVSGGADATSALPKSLDRQQQEFNDSTTFGERLGNSVRRGVQGFRTAVQSGLAGERMQTADEIEREGSALVGGIPFAPEDPQATARSIRQVAAQNITKAIDSQREAAKIPQSPAVRAFTGAQSFEEGLSALSTDPLGVIGAVGVESTVQYLPALATMAATRNPGAAMLAGGLNSAGLEYGGSLLEYLGKNGVDTNNAQAVQAALSDPSIAQAANEFAKRRAGIIATADAATAGLASKVPFARPFASKLANEALNAGVIQPGVQGIAGAGAEATAQLATEGRISAPGQILAEGAGEFFGAPAEVAPAAIDRIRQSIRTGDPDVDAGANEAQSAIERARARIRAQVAERVDPAPNVSTTVPNVSTSRLEQRRAEIAAREAGRIPPDSGLVPPDSAVIPPDNAAPDDLDSLLADRFAEPDPFAPVVEPEQPPTLRGLDEEIGWAERGGRLLRAADDASTLSGDPAMAAAETGRTGEVIGRTSWQPKSDFWPTYRSSDKNPLSEEAARTALAKVESGEPLTFRERRFVDFAQGYVRRQADERADGEDVQNPTMTRAIERYQRGQISEEEMAQIRAGELAPEDAIPFSRRKPQAPAQDDTAVAPSADGLTASEGDPEALAAMQDMERRRLEGMSPGQFAATAMRELGKAPGAFRTQLVPGQTIRETAEASGLSVAGIRSEDGRKVTEVNVGDSTASIIEDGDRVYVNLADLTAGSGQGERVYNAAFSYARNTGKTFVEDPEGLSDRALYRRPVQQASMMMKAGSAENIAPGPMLANPPKAGPAVRPIRYDSQQGVDAALAENLRTVYANTVRAIPEAANVGYDFKRDAYFERGADGKPVRDLSDIDIQRLADSRRANPVREAMVRDGLDADAGKSAPPVGGASIKVAALTDTLLRASGVERSAILGELGRVTSSGLRNTPAGLKNILPSRRGGGTINVDGVDRPRLNSEGRPIAPDDKSLRNFWRWFGDSRVVDAEGRPLVVYHGTKDSITTFRAGGQNGLGGIYFTTDPKLAGRYAGGRGGANVVPVYLSIQNPRVTESTMESAGASVSAVESLRQSGFDGIINSRMSEIVAFDSEQVKSATGNRGTFDPKNPDIRYSRRNAQQRRNLKTINVEVTTSDGETVTARADVVLRAAEKRLNALSILADCIRR